MVRHGIEVIQGKDPLQPDLAGLVEPDITATL